VKKDKVCSVLDPKQWEIKQEDLKKYQKELAEDKGIRMKLSFPKVKKIRDV
jgi:hypothetical protein